MSRTLAPGWEAVYSNSECPSNSLGALGWARNHSELISLPVQKRRSHKPSPTERHMNGSNHSHAGLYVTQSAFSSFVCLIWIRFPTELEIEQILKSQAHFPFSSTDFLLIENGSYFRLLRNAVKHWGSASTPLVLLLTCWMIWGYKRLTRSSQVCIDVLHHTCEDGTEWPFRGTCCDWLSILGGILLTQTT